MRLSVNAGLSVVVLAVMAAELLLPVEALEYRRALAAREPWRLFSGHFVHLGSCTHCSIASRSCCSAACSRTA